jgi:hypothetical protein
MGAAARVRSGTHLRLRGRVWWYRRDVPKDVRKLLECTAVWKSLETSDENEAKRLEKVEDVKFERRLRWARDSADPEKRRSRAVANFIDQVRPGSIRVGNISRGAGGMGFYLSNAVCEEDQRAVSNGITSILDEHGTQLSKATTLLREIAAILPGLPQDAWERCQRDVLSVVQHYALPTTNAPSTVEAPEICFWGVIFDTWEKETKPTSRTIYSWKRIVRKLVAHQARTPKLTVEQAMAWSWRNHRRGPDGLEELGRPGHRPNHNQEPPNHLSDDVQLCCRQQTASSERCRGGSAGQT